jgi:hypothetical protein
MPAKQGSGVPATQIREVEPFQGVSLSGSGSVDISVGTPQSVSVKFDDNLIEDVVTRVDSGVLKIHVEDSYSSSVGLQIKVVTESLDKIRVSGAGAVTAKDIESGNLSAHISGVGKISLTGEADTLAVKISGAGKLDAEDLKTKTAGVSISGVGKANIHSTQSVNAAISGAGKVNIYGNPPEVKKQVSGVGKVEVK